MDKYKDLIRNNLISLIVLVFAVGGFYNDVQSLKAKVDDIAANIMVTNWNVAKLCQRYSVQCAEPDKSNEVV